MRYEFIDLLSVIAMIRAVREMKKEGVNHEGVA